MKIGVDFLRTIRTHCMMCPAICEIEVDVENDKIVGVRGAICPRGNAIPEFQRSPDRLINPVKRIGKTWKTISWGVALNTIVDKLNEIRSEYGPQSLAVSFYRGTVFWYSNLEELVRRFCDLYGACLFSGPSTMCLDPIEMGIAFTFGSGVVIDDVSTKSKCILCWGQNPYESKIPLKVTIRKAKKAGAKLIVIDPRTTETAKEADIHAKIRPGTDLALALGLLNIIISEELYDKDFVERWTVGFNELAKYVDDFPAERVEKITLVPANIIAEIAREYASLKPAVINYGMSVFSQSTNNFQAIRALAILISITGNLDVPGGNIFASYPPASIGRLVDRKWGQRSIPISPAWKPGAEKFPLYCNMFEIAFPQHVLNSMLTEKPFPIKAAIIFAHNPVLTVPNSEKVKKALDNLDFLVVMDFFMTETAKLAHIVLPAATFLERTGYRAQSSGKIKMINKAVEPPGECWTDLRFWCELSRRMGYEDYFPWASDEEYLETLLRQMGRTLEKAKKEVSFLYPRRRWRRYEKEGFRTSSGKVEIYSQFLTDHGIDPLPIYEEPAESPISRPDLVKMYPIILTTGGRSRVYTHSQFRNLPSLQAILPENFLEINRKDAGKYHIQDGDTVLVETPRGKIRLKAKYADILEGVVHIMHGWPKANVNLLTDDVALNPVTGSPGTKALLCRVRKA